MTRVSAEPASKPRRRRAQGQLRARQSGCRSESRSPGLRRSDRGCGQGRSLAGRFELDLPSWRTVSKEQSACPLTPQAALRTSSRLRGRTRATEISVHPLALT
jgi:hypothetical protein